MLTGCEHLELANWTNVKGPSTKNKKKEKKKKGAMSPEQKFQQEAAVPRLREKLEMT